jgi:hypothetical protein
MPWLRKEIDIRRIRNYITINWPEGAEEKKQELRN